MGNNASELGCKVQCQLRSLKESFNKARHRFQNGVCGFGQGADCFRCAGKEQKSVFGDQKQQKPMPWLLKTM
jgi:hypothetical protein